MPLRVQVDDRTSHELTTFEIYLVRLLEDIREDQMARPRNPDPVIAALFAKLPTPGAVWPASERKAWMAAVTAALGLLYQNEPQEPNNEGG
jgi:hypothetical protein